MSESELATLPEEMIMEVGMAMVGDPMAIERLGQSHPRVHTIFRKYKIYTHSKRHWVKKLRDEYDANVRRHISGGRHGGPEAQAEADRYARGQLHLKYGRTLPMFLRDEYARLFQK